MKVTLLNVVNISLSNCQYLKKLVLEEVSTKYTFFAQN